MAGNERETNNNVRFIGVMKQTIKAWPVLSYEEAIEWIKMRPQMRFIVERLGYKIVRKDSPND